MSTNSYSCRKHFHGYPCCHRQWSHLGHCRYVHGYSRSFTFWFKSIELDSFGFVVDFSSLKSLEKKLRAQFDHTFLINYDDPLLAQWEALHKEGAIDLRIMKNVGMEGTAELIWEWSNELLLDRDSGRTCCWKAQASENKSNAASYELTPNWYGK